jgi:hypothetical protein
MKFFDPKVAFEDMEIFSFPDLSFKNVKEKATEETKAQSLPHLSGRQAQRNGVNEVPQRITLRNSAYPAAPMFDHQIDLFKI